MVQRSCSALHRSILSSLLKHAQMSDVQLANFLFGLFKIASYKSLANLYTPPSSSCQCINFLNNWQMI